MLNKLLKEYERLQPETKEYYSLFDYVHNCGSHEDLKEFDLMAFDSFFATGKKV